MSYEPGKRHALLVVEDLAISYGSIRAVKGISFEVHEGEIVTLIGANGAGKSSTLRGISGMVPYKGKITYKGQDLHGIDPAKDRGTGHRPGAGRARNFRQPDSQ